MSMLEKALEYASKGLRVIPIAPGEKHPKGIEAWQDKSTTDTTTITEWFTTMYKGWGVGIATGKVKNSYVFVLDIDDRDQHRGSDTLNDLEAEHGRLPDTVTVHTPSGGRHLYFRSNTNIRNDAGTKLGPGLDIRGEGGQVLAPPTIHPNGKPYVEDTEQGFNNPPAYAPDWLIERLTRQPKIDSTRPSATDIFLDDPNSPSSRFNAQHDWHGLLIQDGWTHAYSHNGVDYYRRPGKDQGVSATVNYNNNDALIVFSTNAPIPQGGYSRFGYYAQTRHGGSWKQAAASFLRIAPTEVTATTNELLDILIDWHEFWNEDQESQKWIAYPLIAESRQTALFAVAKVGKSMLALACTAALATGRPIFGKEDPEQKPIPVLYLDYEMNRNDLMDRLETLGYSAETDLTHLHYALIPNLPPLNTFEGAEQLVALCRLTNSKVVVIDTTGRAVEGEENSADTYRDFARTTGLRLRSEGIALLRTDHAGKDKGKSGQRGSSAKNDDVDIVYHMEREAHIVKLTRLFSRIHWAPETVEILSKDFDDHTQFTIGDSMETFTEPQLELAKQLMATFPDIRPGCTQKNTAKFRSTMRAKGIKAKTDKIGPALRAIRLGRVSNHPF